MTLEETFSKKNMIAYSDACTNLALDFADTRAKKAPIDTLVIPSRGAFPFFLGMTHALRKFREFDEGVKKTYRDMAIQPILEPLMPRDAEISSDIHSKGLRVLLIPFTADLNIPKFDSDASNEEYTEKTREYWARVTHAFFKEPGVRRRNPYFKVFTDIILRELEGRQKTAEVYEGFPKIERFAMIDTVISGRASNDILGAFDNIQREQQDIGAAGWHDIPPHAFLIVDKDGEKLERHRGFSAYLHQRQNQGTARLYPIPQIVSEDQNSALLGVSATVYPSLMKASKELRYNGREFFIGAGSWHINPEARQFRHFQQFMELVYSGIDLAAAEFLDNKSVAVRLDGEFEEKRRDFVRESERSGLTDLSEYETANDDRLCLLNKDAKPIYETHSHVIHVPLNSRVDSGLITKICGYGYMTCHKKSSA